MPGKKRALEEVPNDNFRRLRSRTVRIGNQTENQLYISSRRKIESDVPKTSAAFSTPPMGAKREPQHLLSIFPAELWLLVAEKVEDSNDLESLSNSSLFFRDLLLPQRVNFLFQNVWKVLESQNEAAVSGFNCFPWSWNIWEEERIPSRHRCWLTQLLSLRLVCRSWNKGVDSYYQNHPVHFKLEKESRSGEAVSLLRPLIQEKFSTMMNEQRSSEHFLRHFNPTHSRATADKNPFFGRRVFLGCSWRIEDPLIAAEKVVNVLSEYGHHVWYCSLDISQRFYYSRENRLNSALNYQIIRQIVALMPNLKVLQLKLPYNFLFGLTDEDQIELQNEIESNPFPTFKNLEILSTTYLATPIFDELIRSNAHISALDIRRQSHHEDYGFRDLPMPNLKTLSIEYYSYADFQNLSVLRAKWPLEKLFMSFDRNNFIEWQRVFDVLHNNWSETLTHLELTMPLAFTDEDKERIKRQCGSFTLNLPHLTYLKLEMNTATCLDFLLPLKNSLSVFKLNAREVIRVPLLATPSNARLIDTWNNVERGKVIKLLSCNQRPWKSNMWTLFPKLKLIECQQDVTKVTNNNWSDTKTNRKKWSLSRREWEMELQKNKTTKLRKK